MSIVLDVIVVAIVALVAWRSAKRGFVRTVVEFVGYIAALFIAASFSSVLAEGAYTTFVRPSMVRAVEQSLEGYTGSNLDETVDQIFEQLPGFVVDTAQRYNVTESSVKAELDKTIGSGASETAAMLTDYIAKPIITGLLGTIFMVLLFIVCLLFVRILARMANRAFSLPVVGTANRVLGGVIGVPKGIVFAVLVVWVVGLSISLTQDGLLGVTRETIENSHIFEAIDNLNPFLT